MAKGLGVRREVEIRLYRERISEKKKKEKLFKCFKVFGSINFLIYFYFLSNFLTYYLT